MITSRSEQISFKVLQAIRRAFNFDEHSLRGVSNPAGKLECGCQAVDERAKTHALDRTSDVQAQSDERFHKLRLVSDAPRRYAHQSSIPSPVRADVLMMREEGFKVRTCVSTAARSKST